MDDMAAAWLAAAKDDLLAIDALLREESLTNIVAFHAQQAVEKAIKAVLEKHAADIPHKHDLLLLKAEVSRWMEIEGEDILDSLNDLYIEARYPSDLGLLPDGKPTKEEAESFQLYAKELVSRVGTLLFTAEDAEDTELK